MTSPFLKFSGVSPKDSMLMLEAPMNVIPYGVMNVMVELVEVLALPFFRARRVRRVFLTLLFLQARWVRRATPGIPFRKIWGANC